MKKTNKSSQDYKMMKQVRSNICELRKLDAICIQLNNSSAYALVDEVEDIQRQILVSTMRLSKSVDLSDEDVKYLNWLVFALS